MLEIRHIGSKRVDWVNYSQAHDMNDRERYVHTVHFEPVDALPIRHAYGLMPGVLDQWHAEGLPQSVQTPEDILAYFGFAEGGQGLPINIGFDPGFETRVIEDCEEYTIAIDWWGRRTKRFKRISTIAMACEFPVTDSASWQDYKRRLHWSASRIGPNLAQMAADNLAKGRLSSFSFFGFYWFPRDLMGDEALCIAYYEQPDLVREMLETWCTLVEKTLDEAARRVRIDVVATCEDMAYRNGSMVGPRIFNDFIRPYYLRIHRVVQQHNIPVFLVDSDGNVDELSEWFMACGVNLMEPYEVQAGNDLIAYRKRFGRRLAFQGGLDKLVLPKGPAAIDAMLTRIVPFMKKSGGGWIPSLDHRIVVGTRLSDFQFYVRRLKELVQF